MRNVCSAACGDERLTKYAEPHRVAIRFARLMGDGVFMGLMRGWVSRLRCSGLGLLMLVSLVPSGHGQNSSAKDNSKLLTPAASLNSYSISDLEFSPDGTRLAFVVTEPPKDTGRKHHIWVRDAQTNAVRQFTHSAKSEGMPRWSPDGKQLAFLSDRGDEQQIYLMRVDMGEAVALTKGKRGVKNFAWSPDGRQIAFLAPDAKTDAEEKKEKDKDDAHVVDKEDKRARLWLVDVATGEIHALTQPTWEVNEVVWTPNGQNLVVKATNRPESDENTDRIFSVQTSDGAIKELIAPRGPFRELRVSPNGNTVSFVGSREDGPEPHDLQLLPINVHAARNLTGASLDRLVEDYHWQKEGSILLLAANGFGSLLVNYAQDGSRQDLAASPTPTGSMAIAPNGEIAYVSQTATRPQELWLWDQKTSARQVSHLNDAWKQFILSTPEYYKYKSFDGQEIEAALLRPPGVNPNAKLPLIALIHGGPTGRWSDSIDTWGQLLVTHGYAVFYPNIRGSVGYGQKFVESNRGDWGGGDFKDVMAGVKDLVNRGIADQNRLGIGGWSYGGYMAEWAITQTNEFKAAVSGAGMANLISEFGMEDHPAGDEWFYGVPWEKPEGFLNSSPFIHLKDAKTPTLVLQGEADTIDPPGQSQELYRGLKRYGVESELVVYPREPHGFHEEKHSVDRLNRILAWYDKYLGGAAPKEN
jgi:dipeptidyl aminopeptidase/acylaminoacyl peptidase